MHFWRIVAKMKRGGFLVAAARLRRGAVLEARAKGLIADGGYEKNLVLLGASIGIALAGPGKLAKD